MGLCLDKITALKNVIQERLPEQLSFTLALLIAANSSLKPAMKEAVL